MENNKLKDHPDFTNISVTEVDNGILIAINGQSTLVNIDDAQFLCDALYVLLDDIKLEADNDN